MSSGSANPTVSCPQWGICGGCPTGGTSFVEQIKFKKEAVASLSKAANVIYTPDSRVRDKADLVWENVDGKMHLGLYRLGGGSTVDLEACPLMSEELESFFVALKKLKPPIQKGSIRIRVSPSGEWGCWLDFANNDVKMLFEEKDYLRGLSEIAFVEIGQRRKALHWVDGQAKLKDPEFHPWFETYDRLGHSIPLFGVVGGFSQTGFAANKRLVNEVCKAAEATQIKNWVELFCGNGNFTLALAAREHYVEAYENEALALEGLKLSLNQMVEGPKFVKIFHSDVYSQADQFTNFADKGLLVDPPRSGLRELLTVLKNGPLPKAIIYVSCFAESLLKDSQALSEMGFKVSSLTGIDQFPYSPHCEWVTLFVRN